MFEHHFGLRENPFAAGHQSRFVYPSREYQEAIAHLRFGIENREPFVLITGEVGTGKTTALYDVLAEYESRAVVALITNSSLTRDELLEEICLRFGLAAAGTLSKPQAIVALERFLREVRARGHHAILILDEAQNLERDLLEEIRLLSNLEEQGTKLIQLFLVGQPELEEKLAKAELRQLRQRITVFYRLGPLSPDDTERYIHHRISVAGGHALTIFPPDACREVHAITHGIPREINTVAAQAMLNAYVEDSASVRPEHVRTVERDSEFRSVLRGGAGGARISSVESAPGYATPGAPAQATGAAPTPPSATGPPPLHPAETHATSPAASAAPAQGSTPAPIAPGPPPLHPAETPPASAAPTGPSPPRKPGAVAPAGSAEAWGTWLSSLAQIPSQIDETLAEALGTAPASMEKRDAQTPAPAASSAAPAHSEPPARAEVAPTASAPAHVEPPRAETVVTPSAPAHPEPPRAEIAATPSAPARTEPVARIEPAPRVEPPPVEANAPAAPAPRHEEAPWGETTAPAAPKPRGDSTAAIEALRTYVASRENESAESATAKAQSAPEEAGTSHRTPRRLEFMEEEPTEEGSKALRWLVFAGVIAVVAVSSVLGIRAWLGAAKSAQSAPASAVSPAPAEAPATTSPAATSQGTGASSAAAGSAAAPAPTTTSTITQVPRSSASSSLPSATVPPAATQTASKPAGASASSGTKPHTGTTGTAAGGTAAGGAVAGGAAASGAVASGVATGGAAAGGMSAGGAAAGGSAAGGAVASGASAGGAAAGGAATGGAAASGASSGGATAGGASTSAAPAKSSTTPQGLFGIAVGTYMDEERANEERAKLVASTSLPARVLTVTENDVEMYRLVMGSFESRRQAESAASRLIEKGLVDEARVVPLSTATASQP